MRKFLVVAICLLPFVCFAQSRVSANKQPDIISKIQAFVGQHFVEKVYLQFDKPYYAGGDTIFFKAYTTMGERHYPSTISNVLYVDLINANNKIDQSIKLQVNNGVANGDFALPDTLPTGNYQVRAYTRWMHNDGDDSYFYQAIPIASLHKNDTSRIAVLSIKAKNTRPDIQFFPEGGTLVMGVTSKIAFKAINKNGLGVALNGVIVDNDNKEITTIATSHLGMGSFRLTPQTGKTYIAKLSYTDGTENAIALPSANEKGITLSINNDSLPKASVSIEANAAYYQENKNKEFTLLIYSGAIATSVNCTLDSALITLDLLKRKLHTGIARVTLFSPTNEPLCERLLFIQNYDQLNFAVKTDKIVYSKREKVNVNLKIQNRLGNPSMGNFSVSVTDEGKVPIGENAENTILTNLLLTSDLKGYIEQPNYYFSNPTDKSNGDLDLVMLTHGYRRFDWKQVVNSTYPPIEFQPDTNLEITGTAESLTGKPLASATVSLIEIHSGRFFSRATDEKGFFRFSNLVFSDTAKFILQAVNAKGRNTTKLIYNKDEGDTIKRRFPQLTEDSVGQEMQPYVDNIKKEHAVTEKYGPVKGKLLRTVVIQAKKFDEESLSNNLVSEKFADQVINGDDLPQGGMFADQVEGYLHNIRIQRKGAEAKAFTSLPGLHPVPMGIILDGVQIGSDLNQIEGLEIKNIEVLKFASAAAYGDYGGGGILIVNTKKIADKKVESIGVLPISPIGFYKAREFYSPKYTPDNIANNRPDLRSTVFWKPEIITDKNGEASFDYFNADDTGIYKVTIEGIDENGNIGRQVYRYKVE